jgi:DNA-binding ferritin-like protein
MSSLLDEAIVDAKALREAVLKNAEASLLEAYAPKIEETVARLLEQDPEGGLGLPMDIGSPPADIGAPPGGLGVAPEPQDAETGATFVAGNEEELGEIDYAVVTELDDDSSLEEEIEIDVTRGELQSMLESITRDIEALEEEMEDETESAPEPMDEEQVEIDEDILEAFELNEKFPDLTGDGKVTQADILKGRGVKDDDDEEGEGKEEKKESLEITEDNIADIVESLVVDIMPVKSGWAGTPESVMQHNEELAAAMAQSDKYKEEKEELLKVGQSLQESLEKHQTVNAKLKEVVDVLKEKLDEVNLTNAKLLYTNRILRKSSLNERQKNKIVEALSSAGSVNEAKVLYETLQDAVGSSRKEGPQSLSEAVSRPSTMLPRRKVQDNDSNSFTDRMKMLAGIKN